MNQEKRDLLLQEARDSSIRTEEKIKTLFQVQYNHGERLDKLERWHWTLHGTWAAVVACILFFKEKLLRTLS